MLLQQTKVEQAAPYYQRFLQAFPNLGALAKADLGAVLKAWQGAGYYARARNLHQLAQSTQPCPKPPPSFAHFLALAPTPPLRGGLDYLW